MPLYKITAPNPVSGPQTGEPADPDRPHFIDGVAYIERAENAPVLTYFRSAGYDVIRASIVPAAWRGRGCPNCRT